MTRWAVRAVRSGPARRLVAAGLLAALAGAGLAGCGIPTGTDVRVDGPLPETVSPQASDDPVAPPTPEQADSEVELVEYFLQAAADNPQEPLEKLRAFIHADDREGWQPDPQILVVRAAAPVATPVEGDRVRVEVAVQEVGVLTPEGTIEPRGGTQSREVRFQVVSLPDVTSEEDVGAQVGHRLQLVDPPDEIILATTALEKDYLLPRPVYFWSTDGEVLVPDLRWLPSALPVRQRAQRVLEWLEGGPAPWLPGALVGLPDDVALAGNAVRQSERLEVPLTSAAGEVDLGRLDAQLWWTLRTELAGDRALVLVIDGEERELTGDYRSRNPTAQPEPARFAVVDGVVRQQKPTQQIAVPALASEVGEVTHSAALTRDGRFAALVRARPDGRLQLAVARAAGVDETDLVRDQLSRPVWLAGSDAGLIVAGGELYRFDTDGQVSEVRVPGGLTGVEAVAAAPDARRVALVAGGRLYVASMVWQEGSFSMNEPRQLPTTARDLAGVGFLQENWLAFAGDQPGGTTQLYEITVDGGLERPLFNGELGAPGSVDSFTAYPGDPGAVPPAQGEIMYEAENLAYRYVHQLDPAPITADDLYGVPADAEPGEPRAPFYAG